MIDEQRTLTHSQNSLIGGETGQKKEKIKHATQIFTTNWKHREPTDVVDSLTTHDHLSRWAAALSYNLPADWLQPAEGEHHRWTQQLLITWDVDPEKSVFTSGPGGNLWPVRNVMCGSNCRSEAGGHCSVIFYIFSSWSSTSHQTDSTFELKIKVIFVWGFREMVIRLKVIS